jgi:hypothetical protein
MSVIVVAAVGTMLFVPMTGTAGSLEPSAAPAPTMKTLDQIPPTWSQKISGAARFELVLDGAAVLDKETGLVWEQSPYMMTMPWIDAMFTCQNKPVGDRKGWRLPTVAELASLVDQSVSAPGPTLSNGHPFSSVQSSVYWSATTMPIPTTEAWGVNFYNADVFSFVKTYNGYYVWCVRGGQAYDGQ